MSDRFKLERTPNRSLLLVVVLGKEADLSGSSHFSAEGRPRQTAKTTSLSLRPSPKVIFVRKSPSLAKFKASQAGFSLGNHF